MITFLLALASPYAVWGEGGDDAAYRRLIRLRDDALEERLLLEAPGKTDADPTAGEGTKIKTFVGAARRYLAQPDTKGAQCDRIRVWLGEFLEASDVRAAYALYRQARTPAARRHEARLRARHEPPPPLTVERWIGTSIDPAACRGDVVALVFLSVTHPQTRRVWPYLLQLHERLQKNKGWRLAVLATVVDDHRNQSPKKIAAAVVRRAPPFPVGIDRQQRRGPSATLRAYRGKSLPWVAVIDRYGRLAWSGSVPARANALQRLEQRIAGVLRQPTYPELVRRIRNGDTNALHALGAIRTKDTIDHLLALLEQPGDISRTLLRSALRGLGPAHLALTADARAWWKRERKTYQYSIPQDRFVPRR